MHAYLIQAYNNWELLKMTLTLYDDNRNDIYIHIDKKSKEVDFSSIKSTCKKSKVFFVKRIHIIYPCFSQSEATLELLKAATSNGPYQYYHLLSGSDLPIKTQDYIHSFFETNSNDKNTNFVSIWGGGSPIKGYTFWFRVYAYNYFAHFIRPNNKLQKCLYTINQVTRRLQFHLNLPRKNPYAKNVSFWFGGAWFSITDEFARYVVKKIEWINRVYGKYVFIPDESYIQTLLMNSKFKNTLYKKTNNMTDEGAMRYIDWGRMESVTSPRTWREEDYERLMNSEMLFARKFDPKVDRKIIDLIYQAVQKGLICGTAHTKKN